MNSKRISAIALLGLAAAGSAFGQDSRIAVVDLKAAIQAHPAAGALEAELKTRGANANNVLNAKREELSAVAKEAKETQESPLSRGGDGKLLPEAITQLNQLQQRGAELRKSMLEIQKETTEELGKLRAEGLAEIAELIAAIIKEVNGGRFDIVVDRSSVSRDGLPQVLDWPGATDITEEVIAKLPKEPSPDAP